MTMSPRFVRSRRASSSIAVGSTVGWRRAPSPYRADAHRLHTKRVPGEAHQRGGDVTNDRAIPMGRGMPYATHDAYLTRPISRTEWALSRKEEKQERREAKSRMAVVLRQTRASAYVARDLQYLPAAVNTSKSNKRPPPGYLDWAGPHDTNPGGPPWLVNGVGLGRSITTEGEEKNLLNPFSSLPTLRRQGCAGSRSQQPPALAPSPAPAAPPPRSKLFRGVA